MLREPSFPCLLDGTPIEVRPIDAGDADALLAFHEMLSPETIRLRFFSAHPHLSEREVSRFTHVDHDTREALVAFASGQLIGVGRYDRCGDDIAEVAFVVAEEWQGRGVATVLLDRLAGAAKDQGISRFCAETLGENHKMREVFSHWGRVLSSSTHCGVVHLELALD